MKILVQSLKRLYENGLKGKSPSITKEQVADRVTKGSITTDDYKEITREDYPNGD